MTNLILYLTIFFCYCSDYGHISAVQTKAPLGVREEEKVAVEEDQDVMGRCFCEVFMHVSKTLTCSPYFV